LNPRAEALRKNIRPAKSVIKSHCEMGFVSLRTPFFSNGDKIPNLCSFTSGYSFEKDPFWLPFAMACSSLLPPPFNLICALDVNLSYADFLTSSEDFDINILHYKRPKRLHEEAPTVVSASEQTLPSTAHFPGTQRGYGRALHTPGHPHVSSPPPDSVCLTAGPRERF